MAILNQEAIENSRKVVSGKDGALYNSDGKLLASIEQYQTQANAKNATYQPLGSPEEFEVMTGFGITLTFTELVVEDSQFIVDLLSFMENGEMPEWNFQGVIKGRNGTEERVVYNYCIPSGNIDIQNVTSGDVIKRAWSLYCNSAPKMQGKLTAD